MARDQHPPPTKKLERNLKGITSWRDLGSPKQANGGLQFGVRQQDLLAAAVHLDLRLVQARLVFLKPKGSVTTHGGGGVDGGHALVERSRHLVHG